jgi:transposase InsO family protein
MLVELLQNALKYMKIEKHLLLSGANSVQAVTENQNPKNNSDVVSPASQEDKNQIIVVCIDSEDSEKEKESLQDEAANEMGNQNILGNFPQSISMLSHSELAQLAQMITERSVTTREIMGYFKCKINTVNGAFSKHGIPLPAVKKGRRHTAATAEEVKSVTEYRGKYNVGYQRTAFAMTKSGTPMTAYKVQTIFEENGLYTDEKEYQPESSHPNRFVAKYVNQLWHTDLKYWDVANGSRTYLIAFIDNRSRKILHIETLNDKTVISTSNALRRALEKNSPPHMITTDNGKEFTGQEFTKILDDFKIKHHRINPGNPEENAKIERFWGTLQRAIVDRSNVDAVVNEYNTMWPHRGLKVMLGRESTPEEAWTSEPHYEGRTDLGLVYY